MNVHSVTFGERLRDERLRLGLNQTEFGELGGVTKKTQSLYESGDRSPDAKYLQSLFSIGVNLNYVLTGHGEEGYLPNLFDLSEEGLAIEKKLSRGRRPANKSAIESSRGSGVLLSTVSAAKAHDDSRRRAMLKMERHVVPKEDTSFNDIADDILTLLGDIDEEIECMPQVGDYPTHVVDQEYKVQIIERVKRLKELGAQVQAHGIESQEDLNDFALIPRLDVEASAGHGSLVDSEDVRYSLAFRKDWLKQEFGISPAKLRIITARGDSMDSGAGREKDIHDGDMLLVNSEVTKIEADAIYIIQVDGHVLVKRIQQMFDGSVKIISANPEYAPQEVAASMVSDIRIAGRVVYVIAGRKA